MSFSSFLLCCSFIIRSLCFVSGLRGLQGPMFVQEPPHRLEFSNGVGGRADCSAQGSPQPEVEWISSDGAPIKQISDLRLLYPNGSLVFPPFSSDRYRHEVHAAVYRCRLRSPLGILISREVHVKAVLKQKYEIQVNDEYVIRGNAAVLRCKVPGYVSDYVMVTSWVQDEAVNIYPNADVGGKYVVLGNGDLYVSDAGVGDGHKSYSCRTVHRLTGEVQKSLYPGRVIVTEPKDIVQPRITVDKYNSRRIAVGDDVILPCVAQGHPVPDYYWKRELQGRSVPLALGERLTMLTAGLLKISKVRLEDRGVYICHANNSAGEENVRVTLEIRAPVTAHVQPQTQTVDVGREANFECIAGGFPISQVSWYHDGEPIAQDNNGVEVKAEPPSLTVRRLSKEDEGMYQCFVSNNWEQAQATAELNLGDAGPELTHWFPEQTLQPGPTVSLKCVASGNPPPRFTWTLDGFPLPDDPRFLVGQYVTVRDDVISHVNITGVKAEDGGEYTCSARNGVGTVSHSARVNVFGLPYIRPMPRVVGIAGLALAVKCPVGGYPVESVTWERHGQVLPLNRRQRVYPNGTLVVEQTQKDEDAGTYTCQAKNGQRNTARRDVQVQVLVPPKIFPVSPMVGLLREGMRAAITCQIMEGDLPVSFRWDRNGESVAKEEGTATVRRIDDFSSSLVIDQVASGHAGNYTCTASNAAGSEKYTVPLTVNVPPKWTVEPTDGGAAAGQEVALHCQADGYPDPIVSWKKAVGGQQPGEYKDFLFEPNARQYRNGSVVFAHVRKENEGHYMCEAKNGIGSGVSKVVFLKVNAPARFPQKNRQLRVVKGERAHLQCSATGDTPMEMTWRKEGQEILRGGGGDRKYTMREQKLAEGMASELGIERTARGDTATFTCSAANAYGRDEMNVQLIVQEAPEPPDSLKVAEQSSRSVALSWTQPYSGNSPITGYVIQYKLGSDPWPASPPNISIPGSATSASVQNLRPAQVYHVRILAENRLGRSEPSQSIQVGTLEEVPSGSPQAVRAEAKSSTELVVSWEAPPRDSWNGVLLGYHVGYREGGSANARSYKYKSVEVRAHFGGEAALAGLGKYTNYTVVVQAYNGRGSGPASEAVTARTLEDSPSLPPQDVHCSVLSSESLRVTWQPPPAEGRNGVLLGYKVSFRSFGQWMDDEDDDQQTKVVSALGTTLVGLKKYCNYSVSVLGYTAPGDGVTSEPVYCRTQEDVPSAPEAIKASASAPNKILISWLPPKNANGHLVSYTFYMTVVESGQEEGTHKRVLSPAVEMHETPRIPDSATCQFWVTASTRVGEGERSRVLTAKPSRSVPAKVASFGRKIVSAWKRDVQLPCWRVGVPLPQPVWKTDDQPVEVGGRRTVAQNGSLLLREVQSADEGNYTCSVENQHGKDEIVYSVRVLVPPEAPLLAVVQTFADNLLLKWTDRKDGGSPVLGYVINYKGDHGDWEELQVSARSNEHMLRNLRCGTKYLLYVTSFNRIGTGLPSDIVTTRTEGTTPVRPKQSQMLTMNSTVATIWLDSWGDGGCGILHFAVEYRPGGHSPWLPASNRVKPTERIFSIGDLWPATEYQVKVVAYNNAGETTAIYNFTTLTTLGIVPELSPPVSHSGNHPLANARVLVPIVLSVLVLLALIATLLWRRKVRNERDDRSRSMGESPSMAQMQNKQNRDQQYLAAVRVGRGHQQQQQQSLGIDTCKSGGDSGAEYIEDVCPYATFQLSKPTYSESSYSGNVYSGPYHSVRGSFVYHDVKPPPANKIGRTSKEPEYTKVRRKGGGSGGGGGGGRLRDPHSESQESDNLGSTDSEVKKILTLHLPISEYDTLGSDSEGDAGPASQELMSFTHRMRGGAENSSTSSSDSSGRKPYQSRRSNRGGPLTKRHVRSSSGYSSHNDETTFSISHAPSFNERLHRPPGRFSDAIEKGHRKGQRRGSAASKLTREAFQINV